MSKDIIVKLQADITKLEKGLKTANEKIESVSKTTKESTNGMKDAFKKVGGVIATAFAVDKIVDFGRSIVDVTTTFSDSILNVKALTGATDKEFQALNDTAIKFGSTTAHTASDSADAMGYMALAGWNTTQIMDGLAGVLNLASAGGLDLASTSDYLTDSMSMFSMEAKESNRTADVWAKAQAKSNMNVQQLGEAMKYAGATASSFGLDIEQTTALLGIMANNGIKASQGGTSLKGVLSRMAGPTKAVIKGFGTLGISAKDLEKGCGDLSSFLPLIKERMSKLSDAQRVQVAKQIAGSEAMSGFLAIVEASTDSLPELTDSLYKSGGFAEETAQTMESGLGGAFRSLESAWEGFQIKLGQKIEVPLTDLIQKLAEFINNLIPMLKDFWKEWGEVIKNIGALAAVFAVVFPLVKTGITLFKTFKKVMTALKAVKSIGGAFKLVGGAISSCFSPAFLITAAIVAIIAVGYLLWKNWDTIKQKAIEIWTAIKNWFIDTWKSLKKKVVEIWGSVKDWFASTWKSIKDTVVNIWTSIKNWFIDTWNNIVETCSSIWNGVVDFFAGVWESITTTVISVWTGIKDFFAGVWDGICSIISNVVEAIASFLTSAWERIYTIIKLPLELIHTFVSFIWQGIQLIFAVVVTAIVGIIRTAFNLIKTVITTVLEVIKGVVSTVWDAIKNAISTVLDIITGIVTTVWEAIKTAITTASVAVLGVISKIWESIKSVTSTVWNAIKGFISKVWSSIKSIITTVMDAIKGFLTKVWNGIRDFMIGVASAIKTKIVEIFTAIKNKISEIFTAVKTTVVNIWGGIKNKISDVVNGIKTVVSNAFTAVKDKTMSIFNGLKNAVQGIWKGIGKGIQSCVNGIIKVINGMVKAMNKISFDVPDWVPGMGGKSFGFNIPTVSEVNWFATGGIIKGTTGGSIVGVGEAGDEAIVPLSNKSRMKPFAEAVANLMPDNKATSDGSGGSEGVTINVGNLVVREEADVKKVAQELHRLQDRNRRKRGVVYA